MKFKRLLTVGLMALFCAGTATAASQLNSVRVTPKANTATVSLQTNGSFAHKEYRPDQHRLLIDLTGVTADPGLVHTVVFRSPVLKSYLLSSYASASGAEVTRLELTLGDNVTANVADVSTGLQITLSGGGPEAASSAAPVSSTAPVAAPASAPVAPKPALEEKASPLHPAPQNAVAHAQDTGKKPVAGMEASERQGGSSSEPARVSRESAPTIIRNVSVRRGEDSLDVVVDGPSTAHPYLLKNPDRLVVDFDNAVMRPSSKNIAVRNGDVTRVRVGRFRATPPVTRVVIDLGGPRVFEVVPTADQVVVRVKTEADAKLKSPLKPLPVSARVSAASSERAARHASVKVQVETSAPKRKAAASPMASASPIKDVSMPATSAPAMPREQAAAPSVTPSVQADAASVAQNREPAVTPKASESASKDAAGSVPAKAQEQPVAASAVSAAMAADSTAPELQAAKAAVEMARLSPPADFQPLDGSSAAPSSPQAAKPRYTGEPISVNLKDVDLKDFFRLIHEISGLNIVLDPSVHGSVTLVLDDVPWDQALDIVLKNNALDRELQGNVLRIASTDTLRREAVDRRAQAEAVALAVDRQTITRSLSYAKAKEVVPTIKKFLTARGDVIADERTNALIISDIPSVLPNLDRLITQLDKKTQEVEIEVRVVSATRSFSRDLGVQLGFNWGNGATTLGGSNPNGATLTNTVAPGSSTTTGGTGATTTLNSVPLFSNFPASGATTGFSFSNITSHYGIDAVLTAAESHNLAKVLSRPRVVTQSNVKAEIKQGVEIPVYTAGTANANSSVSYVNAVLRLSVTPQITADNTIFLTVDVENTQPNGELNNNFILSTQQATTQVLVSDGATVVIGGVIQTSNTVSTTQTPLLGSIPWLGNLFKERSVSTQSNELIFFITPKIIQT